MRTLLSLEQLYLIFVKTVELCVRKLFTLVKVVFIGVGHQHFDRFK